MKVIVMIVMIAVLSVTFLSASEDIFFSNTDFRVGFSYSDEIDANGLQVGSVSQFHGTNHRMGMDAIRWFVDNTGYRLYARTDLNLNHNYLFFDNGWFAVYSVASLGYHFHYKQISGQPKRDKSEIAYGLGGGMQFTLPLVEEYQSNRIKIYIEPRYFFNGEQQFQFTVGGSVRYPG